MNFEKGKILINQDPRKLNLEALSFLQSSVMAKLLLVNNELIRRYSGLGKVALEMGGDKEKNECLSTFFAVVDRCEQMNAILNDALAENLPQKTK